MLGCVLSVSPLPVTVMVTPPDTMTPPGVNDFKTGTPSVFMSMHSSGITFRTHIIFVLPRNISNIKTFSYAVYSFFFFFLLYTKILLWSYIVVNIHKTKKKNFHIKNCHKKTFFYYKYTFVSISKVKMEPLILVHSNYMIYVYSGKNTLIIIIPDNNNYFLSK